MKQLSKTLSMLLSVVLLFSFIKVASANEVLNTDMAWNYDNSFVVTVEVPEERNFTCEDFPEVTDLKRIVFTKKQISDASVIYEMILVIDGDAETAITALANHPIVTEINRNYYVEDYAYRASYINLNQSRLWLPLGDTAELWVAESNMLYKGFEIGGILFTINTEKVSLEELEARCDIVSYQIVDENTTYEYIDGHLMDRFVATNNDTAEPNSDRATYYAPSADIHALCQTPGVLGAQYVYKQLPPGASAPSETWIVAEPDVVEMALSHIQQGYYSASITGKTVGTTTVTAVRDGGCLVTKSDVCVVTVYLPGDVDLDGKVNAADALQVLRHAVGKTQLSQASLAAADFAQSGKIDAGTALSILKFAVGKLSGL